MVIRATYSNRSAAVTSSTPSRLARLRSACVNPRRANRTSRALAVRPAIASLLNSRASSASSPTALRDHLHDPSSVYRSRSAHAMSISWRPSRDHYEPIALALLASCTSE
jgi:hypothetical protein